MSGEFTGHIVSFQHNKIPAGYIVLDKNEEEHPIIEYTLEGGSVYDYLMDNISTVELSESAQVLNDDSASNWSVEENILYTDFLDYSLKVNVNNEVMLFNQNGQFDETSVLQNRSVSPTGNSNEDYYPYAPETGSPTSNVYLPGFYSFVPVKGSNMPNYDSTTQDNCGPTALTNVVKLYATKVLNGNSSVLGGLRTNASDDDTYLRMVALSGYTPGNPVTMSRLLSTIRSYSSERGYSCTTDDYALDLWSDFTRDITARKPILLYTANALSAHAQVVGGYSEYSNGAKYLVIASGWYAQVSYVKFKPASLTKFNGYAVSITR